MSPTNSLNDFTSDIILTAKNQSLSYSISAHLLYNNSMKFRLLAVLAVCLAGCRLISPSINTSPFPSPSAVQESATPPPATETAIPVPTPTEDPAFPFEVRLHPEEYLIVGDLVSFEVISPQELDVDNLSVEIKIDSQPALTLGPIEFSHFGISDRHQATLRWAWDTQNLLPGTYTLNFQILPDGPNWSQSVTLQDPELFPQEQFDSEWVVANTTCCVIHYLTNTSAEREIEQIIESSERAAQLTIEEMGIELLNKVELVLMPRVLGHGGFASREIYISFLDRNYAGNDLQQVLRHEIAHILDSELGGEFRPTIFVEGLAVYLSGGHFKPEPLMERAASLIDLGWYLPLAPLADDFYFQQHEIGYLEAGALIEFMVETWGYEAFDDFYRAIDRLPDRSHSELIDNALQQHFGLGFDQLEAQFIAALKDYDIDPLLREDVRLTVAFFDTVRRYQLHLDESAYFLTAWLVTLDDLTARDIAADYLRHPSQPENLVLETMLIAAEEQFVSTRHAEATTTLEAINAVLDAIEAGKPEPFKTHPLALNYFKITTTLLENDLQPQQIWLDKNSAQAIVYGSGLNVIEINLIYIDDIWQIEL